MTMFFDHCFEIKKYTYHDKKFVGDAHSADWILGWLSKKMLNISNEIA